MSERTHQHPHEGIDVAHTGKRARPYWRRAHQDWRFWVAVVFIFAALAIYITSVGLSLVPRPDPPTAAGQP